VIVEHNIVEFPAAIILLKSVILQIIKLLQIEPEENP
jgi:hypothetical protein